MFFRNSLITEAKNVNDQLIQVNCDSCCTQWDQNPISYQAKDQGEFQYVEQEVNFHTCSWVIFLYACLRNVQFYRYGRCGNRRVLLISDIRVRRRQFSVPLFLIKAKIKREPKIQFPVCILPRNSFSFSKLLSLISCSILQLSSYAVSSSTPNAISASAITL